jgi:hypothetical protein
MITRFICYLCDVLSDIYSSDSEEAYRFYRRLTGIYWRLYWLLPSPVLRFKSGFRLLKQLHTVPVDPEYGGYLYEIWDEHRRCIHLSAPRTLSKLSRGVVLFFYGVSVQQGCGHLSPLNTAETRRRILAAIVAFDNAIRKRFKK